MTFSFTDRLYSMITGEIFSSMPNVSILPACFLPVLYSEAKKRIPKNVSRCRSIIVCNDFSTANACPTTSSTLFSFKRNILISPNLYAPL